MQRFAGVASAVFPNESKRSVYNNALLDRDLAAGERTKAIYAMEAAYEAAGVTRFAAWVHESDQAMRSDLERRGYTVDEVTRAMGMTLDDIVSSARARAGPGGLVRAPRIAGMPPGFLSGIDTAAFHVLVARAAAKTSRPPSRTTTAPMRDIQRRNGGEGPPTWTGYGADRLHLHDARARGCRTASLQSTAMAERLYAAVGFRDLGRILEYVPQQR